MRLSADKQLQMAHFYAEKLKPELGEGFMNEIINAPQKLESQIIKQRERVEILKNRLQNSENPDAKHSLFFGRPLGSPCSLADWW